MSVKIVIGLGFGDEGKGLTTNFLTPDQNSIVVRFSGGQQAGHTVIHNNIKHVHSSYGSGSLKGVPTYISEHCTIDVEAMLNEHNVLKQKIDNVPPVYVHPLAMVTTWFDVIENQTCEKYMMDGTTGMGCGKTIERNKKGIVLQAIDLLNKDILKAKIKAISDFYLRSHPSTNDYADTLIDAASQILQISPYADLHMYRHLIFEGSQGILLDMDHGTIPNVTYSNTTSKNALEICKKIEARNIEVWYVTRCYQTRHGNGWMSKECPLHLTNNQEETNASHEYQGSFRVGYLDPWLINHALEVDNIYSEGMSKKLMITCMDQMKFTYSRNKFDQQNHIDEVFFSYSADGAKIHKENTCQFLTIQPE